MVLIQAGEFERMNHQNVVMPGPLEPTADWKKKGNCFGLGTKADGVFFPEQGRSTREAKMICDGCPVLTECLNYALDRNEKFGVWGGTTERDRRSIRRKRRTA